MAFHKNWEGIVIKEVTWWEAGRNKNKRRESQSERSPTKRKRKNISKPKKSLKTSWPLGASKIQCVILGSSLTRRLQGSCHRSDSKRTKGALSDNVFISRLLLNFFIDIFLYTILFVIIFLKWFVCVCQCDRMLLLLWAHIHNFHIFQQTNCPVGRDNAYYLRTAITMMMILTASSFFMIFIITVLLLNVCALITSWIFSEVIIPWLTWQSLVSKDHNAHFYSNHWEKGQIKNLYSSNWTKQK